VTSSNPCWIASPYLHLHDHVILNPHTGLGMAADDPAFDELRRLILSPEKLDGLNEAQQRLADDGWIIPENQDLSKKFRLRYVSLESHTVCTQACAFCPVSIAPRDPEYMTNELFGRLVEKISRYRSTIEAVTLRCGS